MKEWKHTIKNFITEGKKIDDAALLTEKRYQTCRNIFINEDEWCLKMLREESKKSRRKFFRRFFKLVNRKQMEEYVSSTNWKISK